MSVARGEFLLRTLTEGGRYHFTTGEAAELLGSSLPTIQALLSRLKRKGLVATPHRGLHVIVPPEYRRLGCLPPEQFIPHLMDHLGSSYYLALLSAAEWHGAAHQRPQLSQVMVPVNRRPIQCGRVRVEFVARANTAEIPTKELTSPRGFFRISSPEPTALDLVGYMQHCGGVDNVATVLAELAEVIEPELLTNVAELSPVPWAQRLGYLLDLLDVELDLAPLREFVAQHEPRLTALVPGVPIKGCPRDKDWRVAVNAEPEADL